QGARVAGAPVLDVLRLVRDDACEAHLAEERFVACERSVRGDHEVVRAEAGGVGEPAISVVNEYAQVGCETGGLAAPVLDERRRRDDEGRSPWRGGSAIVG